MKVLLGGAPEVPSVEGNKILHVTLVDGRHGVAFIHELDAVVFIAAAEEAHPESLMKESIRFVHADVTDTAEIRIAPIVVRKKLVKKSTTWDFLAGAECDSSLDVPYVKGEPSDVTRARGLLKEAESKFIFTGHSGGRRIPWGLVRSGNSDVFVHHQRMIIRAIPRVTRAIALEMQNSKRIPIEVMEYTAIYIGKKLAPPNKEWLVTTLRGFLKPLSKGWHIAERHMPNYEILARELLVRDGIIERS